MERMSLGIVVERRDIDHPWQSSTWRTVAVVPGESDSAEWRELARGEGWVRYHAGTLPLEIFDRETEGYRYNLSNEVPVVYVVLREDEDEDGRRDRPAGPRPFLATVCPYEAQSYLDGDEDMVETVPMPDAVAAWVGAFVRRHHVDEPFRKRRRRSYEPGRGGRPPDGPGGVWRTRHGRP